MSLDIDDLAQWQPTTPRWAIGVRLVIGPQDQAGDESFDLTVCSADWLAARVQAEGVVDGRHHLLVERYDWPNLEAYFLKRVRQVAGETWHEVARQLAELGAWEFDQYR